MLAMSGCQRCNDPVGEFFSADGANVCKRCFYAEDTAQREVRAAESVIEEIPGPLQDFVRVPPAHVRTQREVPKPPGTLLRRGIWTMLGGVALTVVTIFLGSGVLFALAVVGLGFMMTVRGYKLRHYI